MLHLIFPPVPDRSRPLPASGNQVTPVAPSTDKDAGDRLMNCRWTSTWILVALGCGALAAQQTDRVQTEALSLRAADRLRALHEEADRLAADERTLLNDLRKLEVERQIRNEEASLAARDAAAVAEELAGLDGQITTLERQDAVERPILAARLVSLYKLGRGRYMHLLLSTSSWQQLGQATRMVGVLSDLDRTRVATHRERLTDLSATRETLRERQARLAALRVESERARSAAEQAVVARNALITDIDQRRDLNAQLSGELLAAQQRLQATLSNLTGDTAPGTASLPIGPFRGDLDWPVGGTLRQRFGGSDGLRAPSTGIDIAAPEGLDVHAIHDGVVAFADAFAGFGRLVIVDHGAQTFSLYGNLKEVALAKGATVGRGDLIGMVGVAATGATGLYFELRVDGRPVDPLQWLRNR
jgi:septal ring factor EnvC (AmiA/AmiB activator)